MNAILTVRDAATCWVVGRRKRGEITESTARDYLPRLDHFARTVGHDRKVGALNRRHVEAWREDLNRLAPATQRAYWGTVRRWLRWLRDEGILTTDPMKDMAGPREPRSVPRALRQEQIRAVLASCDDRARLIVVLMCQMGLRRAEVAAIRIEDIDRGNRLMLVHGKNRDERVLPIPPQALAVIEQYIGTLSGHASGSGSLVRSRSQPWAGVSASTVGRIMSEMLFEAGVKSRSYDGITGHCFRHAAATDMLRVGAHVRDVQAVLGHRSIVTTQRYMPLVVETLEGAMSGRRY